MRRAVLLKRIQVILFACLVIMVAMIAFCTLGLFLAPNLDIAYAQGEDEAFIVSATDYEASSQTALWGITRGDVVVLKPTRGRWSTGEVPTDIAVTIRRAIGEQLKKDGVVDEDYIGNVGTLCTIKFEFEGIDIDILNGVGVYNEKSVSVSAGVDAITTYTPKNIYFEYHAVDSEDVLVATATQVDGGYALPKSLPFGDYLIRLVAEDQFSFEAVDEIPTQYTTYRYSNWLECSVKKASIELPQRLSITPTYGTKVKGMSTLLKSSASAYLKTSGEFVALGASEQTESVFEGVQDVGEAILGVKDGGYMVNFEYVPYDDSYARTTVRVAVVIQPKQIALLISDSFSLEGEPFNYPSYELYNPNELVECDVITDLNVTFDIVDKDTGEKTNGTVVGKFRSVAVSGNANYTIVGYSADTQFWPGGGRYWVYNQKVECTVSDDIKFYVYTTRDIMDNGKVHMSVLNVDEPLKVAGKIFVCAYKIEMFDTFGNSMQPTEDYVISWGENPLGAEWVSAYDGGFDFIKANPEKGIKLASNQNTIYFFKSEPLSKSIIGAYVGGGIACACVFALIVWVICVYVRRALICKKNYKNYVYECEMTTQSVDCANTKENSAQNKTDNNKEKKPRHGKKNKQKNGTKRG